MCGTTRPVPLSPIQAAYRRTKRRIGTALMHAANTSIRWTRPYILSRLNDGIWYVGFVLTRG